MLGSGDGARSTLNSTSKPGTQNETTQKPGARTAHERSKKPNTTKHKTGPRQKRHPRRGPGEPDRRSQKEQGGSRTPVSPFTFLGGSRSWVGALSLWLGLGVGDLRLVCSETPTQHFVIRAANADTAVRLTRCEGRHGRSLRSVLGSAPFGERVRRELSEHLHP